MDDEMDGQVWPKKTWWYKVSYGSGWTAGIIETAKTPAEAWDELRKQFKIIQDKNPGKDATIEAFNRI